MNAIATQVQKRNELLARLAESRLITDDLFRQVHQESLYDRPILERHRIVFYIGHLEAFDWNLIAGRALGLGPCRKEFDRLFAFGIDPVGGGLPVDQPADWPRLAEIAAYNLRIREELDRILSDDSPDPGCRWQYPRNLILNVAIEHRLMHAETLAYMLHQLPMERKITPLDYRLMVPAQPGPPIVARMIDIPAGTATLGMPRGRNLFGWDNEFEEQPVEVPAFAIDIHKVTNGQFLKFVCGGGYENPHFWSDSGWAWIKNRISAIHVFGSSVRVSGSIRPCSKRCRCRSIGRFMSAMRRHQLTRVLWTSIFPPRRSFIAPLTVHRMVGSGRIPGDAPPEVGRGNFDSQRWDPVAVGSYPAGRSAFGLEDALGNGWEWTSSVFAPFPGFEPFPFYDGYSANFFDGKHYVMKGASPRTGACMLRRSFRTGSRRTTRSVYASFRCVSK